MPVVGKPSAAHVEVLDPSLGQCFDGAAPLEHRIEQVPPACDADVAAGHVEVNAERAVPGQRHHGVDQCLERFGRIRRDPKAGRNVGRA
jgi:hypothetical protein